MLKRASSDPSKSQRGQKQSKRKRPAAEDAKADATLEAKTLDDLANRIRICIKCPLCESRTHAVPGEGKPTAKVMIIGEAPGKQEDMTGRPFVGSSGKYLDYVIE